MTPPSAAVSVRSRRGRGGDLHGIGALAGNQGDLDLHFLIELQRERLHVLAIAVAPGFDSIVAGRQVGDGESALVVRNDAPPAAGRHLSELDGGIGDGLIGGVGDDTGDGAADGLGMQRRSGEAAGLG